MIGSVIRSLRKQHNMTLAELAQLVDVSPGGLSQIERGKIDPSLSVIRKISKAFNVPVQSLFMEENHSFITRRAERKKAVFADCGISYEFLTPRVQINSITPRMEIVWVSLAPKSWGSNEITVHEADECLIVLSGSIEVHMDDQTILLNAGDSVYMKENTPHRLYNPTDEEVSAISAMTPAVY